MNKITFELRNGITYCLLNGVVIGQATKAELGMTEKEVLELIEGNPDMEPTDVLEKIKIGDKVFSVGGGGSVDAYELKMTDFAPTEKDDEYQFSQELIEVINEYKRPIYISSEILNAFGLTYINQMMAYPTSEIDAFGGKHYSSLTFFDTETSGEVGEFQSGFSFLQVDGDIYKITFPQTGALVKANETLSGDEETLTSLKVGNTLYKVPQGGGSDYTAGDGVQINNDVISVDRASVQKKLVAGDNIKIDPVYNPYFEQIGTEDWPQMIGRNVWTDGENVYYSSGSDQYVLDKTTSTWSQKIWSGMTVFRGDRIWTDGENVYFSEDSTQYVLDKSTSTWTPKIWTGLTSFNGYKIWTDGENIYYSDESTQYVLNKSTSTWTQQTWNGLTSFDETYVWIDGENIYYSEGSRQYVLNKATSTWSPKVWNGLTSFDGNYIWTDEKNIYYSAGSSQYVLDKVTSTWSKKTWTGLKLTKFYGYDIWTDEENIYYSAGVRGSYVLNRGEVDPNAEEISFSSSLTEQDIKDLFSKYLDSNASFVEDTDPDTGETNYVLNIPRNASYEANATGYTLVVDTDDANLENDTASFGEK